MESEESWSTCRENHSGELVVCKTNRYDGNASLATDNRIRINVLSLSDLITADHLNVRKKVLLGKGVYTYSFVRLKLLCSTIPQLNISIFNFSILLIFPDAPNRHCSGSQSVRGRME